MSHNASELVAGAGPLWTTVCLCLSVRLSVCPSVRPSVCACVRASGHAILVLLRTLPAVRACLSVCVSVMSACLSAYLSCRPVCLCVCVRTLVRACGRACAPSRDSAKSGATPLSQTTLAESPRVAAMTSVRAPARVRKTIASHHTATSTSGSSETCPGLNG